jgi:hypothetical protein
MLIILNFFIAIIALIFSLPSFINQINELVKEREDRITTTVMNYAPPSVDVSHATSATNCLGSIVSARGDAYRCFAGNGVFDPCFWEDKYINQAKDYFYCPADWTITKADKLISVSSSSVERRYFDAESVKSRADDTNKLPWLIYLETGQRCRLASGALGIAYGDKGNLYTCEGDEYSSVTDGSVKGDKYYFQCKKSKNTVFKDCLAVTVIF